MRDIKQSRKPAQPQTQVCTDKQHSVEAGEIELQAVNWHLVGLFVYRQYERTCDSQFLI